MQSGIYVVRCLSNNCEYIGSSVNAERRIKRHLSDLKAGNHRNEYMQNSFNKYGESCFSAEVLQHVEKEELINVEFSIINDRIGSNVKLFNIILDRDDNRSKGQHRFNVDEDYAKRISESKKLSWDANPSRKAELLERLAIRWVFDDSRKEISEFFKALWALPEYKDKKSAIQSERMKVKFEDPEERKIAGENLNRNLTKEAREESGRKGGINLWANPESRKLATEQRKEHAKRPEVMAQNAVKLKLATERSHTKEARAKASASMVVKWDTSEHRAVMAASYEKRSDKVASNMKNLWADPVYREKMMQSRREKKMQRGNQNPSTPVMV